MVEIISEKIVEISLIGLGLVIALYAIIMDTLEDLVKKRISHLRKLRKERDEVFEKLKEDKENEELNKRNEELREEIKTYNKPPFHYDFGYIIAGIFFTLTLIFPFYSTFFEYEDLNVFKFFVDYAPHLLFIGIIVFVIVWFKTMIDLRNLTLGKFDELQEKDEEKEEKEEKILSK